MDNVTQWTEVPGEAAEPDWDGLREELDAEAELADAQTGWGPEDWAAFVGAPERCEP